MRHSLIALLVVTACGGGSGTTDDDVAAPDAAVAPPDAPVYIHDPGLDGPPFTPGDTSCHTVAASAEIPIDHIECIDVTYSIVDGTELPLDLFIPLGTTTQVPAIVYVHGGGWLAGNQHSPGLAIGDYLAAGYVVGSVQYRLTTIQGDPDRPTGVVFPAPLADVKTAVRWFRARAASFVDPDRILIYGFSAGAHLASLVATTDGVPGLEGRGDPAIPSSVVAAVGLSTPIDFHLFVPENPPLDPSCPPQDPPGPGGTPSIGISLLIGGDFADPANAAKLDALSALTYVGANSAPLLVFAGTCDQVVPYMGAAELVSIGTDRGADVHEHLTDHATHGGTLMPPDAKAELAAFIAAHLAQ